MGFVKRALSLDQKAYLNIRREIFVTYGEHPFSTQSLREIIPIFKRDHAAVGHWIATAVSQGDVAIVRQEPKHFAFQPHVITTLSKHLKMPAAPPPLDLQAPPDQSSLEETADQPAEDDDPELLPKEQEEEEEEEEEEKEESAEKEEKVETKLPEEEPHLVPVATLGGYSQNKKFQQWVLSIIYQMAGLGWVPIVDLVEQIIAQEGWQDRSRKGVNRIIGFLANDPTVGLEKRGWNLRRQVRINREGAIRTLGFSEAEYNQAEPATAEVDQLQDELDGLKGRLEKHETAIITIRQLMASRALAAATAILNSVPADLQLEVIDELARRYGKEPSK